MNPFEQLNRAFRKDVDAATFISTFGMPYDTRLAESLDQLEPGQWIVSHDKTTDPNAATMMSFRTQIVRLDEDELVCTDYVVPRHGLGVPPKIFNSGGAYSQGNAIQLIDPPIMEEPVAKRRFSERWRAAVEAFRS